MPRAEVVRSEVQELLRARPFRPFALVLENGQRVIIEHPENIAFDPGSQKKPEGSEDFYVIAGDLRMRSVFGAVTSVAQADWDEMAG